MRLRVGGLTVNHNRLDNPMKNPITVPSPKSTLLVTNEQAIALFGADVVAAASDVRFEIETRGPWSIVSRVAGLAVEPIAWGGWDGKHATEWRIYGKRSLAKPHSCGYDMEGTVSIAGESRRAFTSSALFELPDGRLINCATLYVCRPEPVTT